MTLVRSSMSLNFRPFPSIWLNFIRHIGRKPHLPTVQYTVVSAPVDEPVDVGGGGGEAVEKEG